VLFKEENLLLLFSNKNNVIGFLKEFEFYNSSIWKSTLVAKGSFLTLGIEFSF
jgi:hypothetical protein